MGRFRANETGNSKLNFNAPSVRGRAGCSAGADGLEVTRRWRRTLCRRYWAWQLQRGKAHAVVRYYGSGAAPAGRVRREIDSDAEEGFEEVDEVAPPTSEQLRVAFANISRAHDRGELSDREMDDLVNRLLDAGFVLPPGPEPETRPAPGVQRQ